MAKQGSTAGGSAGSGADRGGERGNKELCAGELKPADGDRKLKPTDTADSIMTQIALLCDDDTGVFFFRHSGSLYLRVVEAE